MATANTKATHVANLDALPTKLNPGFIAWNPVKEAVGVAAKIAGDGDASVYRICRLRSSDRVANITLGCDALAGATSWSIGLYDTAANGGAVVSKDLFLNASDLHLGQALTAVALPIATLEKRVWELLALSKDPNKDYDLCVTLNTAGGAAGNMAVRVAVVAGN